MRDAAAYAPPNYIETLNPFGLPKPPASFLRDLFAYDDKLRLFASNAEPVYRLGRVQKSSTAWQKLPPGHADNATMLKHQITPLKAIQGFRPTWGQVLINALASCDVQRVGGGAAAAELLDQQDELESRRLQTAQDDECDELSGQGYRLAQAATRGRSYDLGTRKQARARSVAGEIVNRPRASGDHAIFVGR